MVKNTTGGTKTKSMARKFAAPSSAELRLPDGPLELIACVTKPLGNGMLQVTTNDNSVLCAHIRNKFRGKQKRHNFIHNFDIVLIGLREWENPSKNADILFLYDSNHISLLHNLPHLNCHNVLNLALNKGIPSSTRDDDLLFSNLHSISSDNHSYNINSSSCDSLSSSIIHDI